MTGSWRRVMLNLRRFIIDHLFRSKVHKAFSKSSGNSPLYSKFEHLITTEHTFCSISKSLLKCFKKKLVSTLIKFISLNLLRETVINNWSWIEFSSLTSSVSFDNCIIMSFKNFAYKERVWMYNIGQKKRVSVTCFEKGVSIVPRHLF